MNPHIAALQSAEQILKSHDAAIAALAEELKAKKKERSSHLARVQGCIDVLCGRESPDLFSGIPTVRTCRVCRCTDDNCEQCVRKTGQPCSWVEDDLCSACLPSATNSTSCNLSEDLRLTFLTSVVDHTFNSVLNKLNKAAEIQRLGEFWDWVEEDGQLDGGMADPNGVGIFGCLRHIGVSGKLANRFAEQVYAYLGRFGVDPRKTPAVDGPVICATVGSVLLSEIVGITENDMGFFREFGALTLADLERKCGGFLDDLPKRLAAYRFSQAEIDRITMAIKQYLDTSTPQFSTPAPKPYGWDITYRTANGETHRCHYVGTEKKAKKKAMLRTGAAEVLTCEGLTEQEWVKTYGRGGM